jgi:phenylacetate-CoA ligase
MGKIENMVRKIGFYIQKKRFEKEYLEISALLDRDSLNNFITQKMIELFLHADKHSRYYNHIFQKIDIIQDGTVDISRIAEIPILTKDIIRKNHQDLISDDYKKRKWFYNSSGGSTGEPIRLIQDDIYLKWRAATNYFYFKNILKIDEPTVKKVVLWGSERDLFKGNIGLNAKIQNWLSNTVFLNSFRMTGQDIEQYIRTINSFKPEIVRGYAGSLFELCRYAEQKKIPLYPPKILVSAAENLSDTMRNVIESNFGTKVFDFYGSREVSNLGGECKDGLLHPFLFWNYLEVLDKENQPVQQGEEGRVIVTNLFNYSMPLIRYEIGDMAIVGPEKCSCGQVLPTLKKVTGRITDHFILEDGTLIHGEYFTHLFYLKDWITSFKVIQEDYLKIRIQIVTKGKVNRSDQADIESKIKLVMSSNCKIDWDIVDEIPKSPSGKYLYTKSLMWR